MKAMNRSLLLFFLLVCPFILAKGPTETNMPIPIITSDLITLQIGQDIEAQHFELTIAGPGQQLIKRQFAGTHIPFIEVYDDQGQVLPDGQYVYEILAVPHISAEGKAAIRAMRRSGDESKLSMLQENGVLPREAIVFSGSFRIHLGSIVVPEAESKSSDSSGNTNKTSSQSDRDGITRDVTFADDLIVKASACIGSDCITGESFGYDTIRLKENNLRINFMDTSVDGFPTNDWQIRINDAAHGGLNRFSIDDLDAGDTPFTIEAGAPFHALYVRNNGFIGAGTSTPAVHMHLKNGNTPALRLEQDGSVGFGAQSWDVAGNEAQFFVRDVTNGSKLPFRILSGASTSSLVIGEDGHVGIGDSSPDAALDIESGDVLLESGNLVLDSGDIDVRFGKVSIKDNQTRVQNPDPELTEATFKVKHNPRLSSNSHILMFLEANGQVNFLFRDSSDNITWKQIMDGGGGAASQFIISRDGSGVNEFILSHNGNLNITGTLTEGSDRTRKQNIQGINPQEVLARVVEMPVSTWSYDTESEIAHMGPMAQDFHAAFGLGATDKGIANIDSSGVAFGAIQGLHQQLEAKDKRIDHLESQLAALEARLKALERPQSDK